MNLHCSEIEDCVKDSWFTPCGADPCGLVRGLRLRMAEDEHDLLVAREEHYRSKSLERTTQPYIVAIDFDGTLAEYDGWRGKGVFGQPVKGAVTSCWALAEMGCTLVVWTCRHREELAIHKWLVDNGFPRFHGVNCDVSGLPDRSPKIVADVYVDDRAVGWQGWYHAVGWIAKRKAEHYSAMHSHV